MKSNPGPGPDIGNMQEDATATAPSETDADSRICVIVNLKSGKQRGESEVSRLREEFGRYGLEVRIEDFEPGTDAVALTRDMVEAGHKTIVAAGGDGTIAGVVGALEGTGCKLGVLPMGTFNYFARSLDIPLDLSDAVRVIADGHTRPLSIATANDEVFLNNANFGLYPQILKTREQTYAFWGRGKLAAYWSVLKTLFRGPRLLSLRIRTDDEELQVRTPMAFVFNNAFQLRRMELEGADCLENGRLALLYAPDRGRGGLFLSTLAMVLGIARKERDFHLVCSRAFEIEAKQKFLKVARDGERETMMCPLRIRLKDQTLDTYVPEGSDDEAR